MSDAIVLNESFGDSKTPFEFVNKQWAFIVDSMNGGVYTQGLLNFNLNEWGQSDQWMHPPEMVCTIPLIMSLSSATAGKMTVALENAFCMNLKAYHHLIHQMTVSIDGVPYEDPCPWSNMDVNYKILSTFSQDDLTNYGPSLNLFKDSGAFTYGVPNNAGNGAGECNNSINQSLKTPAGGFGPLQHGDFNQGRLDRCLNTGAFNVHDDALSVAKLYKNTAELQLENKNYCYDSKSANEIVYYLTATIHMKFHSGLLANLPLMKGAKISISMQTNTNCSVNFGVNAGTVGGVDGTLQIIQTKGSIPFQISPPGKTDASLKTGFVPIITDGTRYTASLSIAKSINTLTVHSHPQSSARMYMPLYTLSAKSDLHIREGATRKHVVYNQAFGGQYLNVSPNVPFSYTLPADLSKLRSILTCMYLGEKNNGADDPSGTTGRVFGSPINSPWSSAPQTVSPFLTIQNYQVKAGTTILYSAPKTYVWETFQQENRVSGSMNGGQIIGASSGIISQADYETNGLNFIWSDLSRKNEASDDIARSVTISGIPNNKVPVDLYFFVNYERTLDIDVLTGKVIPFGM